MTSSNHGQGLTTDVVAGGTGAAGLAGACGALYEGAKVIVRMAPGELLPDQAPSGGRRTNSYLRSRGYEDPKLDALKYMSRASFPELYDPDSPTLGLPLYEYRQIEAYYDKSGPVTDLLAQMGALKPAIETPQGGNLRPYNSFDWQDYHSTLEENRVPVGRGLRPVPNNVEEVVRGGLDMAKQMIARIDHRYGGCTTLYGHPLRAGDIVQLKETPAGAIRLECVEMCARGRQRCAIPRIANNCRSGRGFRGTGRTVNARRYSLR